MDVGRPPTRDEPRRVPDPASAVVDDRATSAVTGSGNDRPVAMRGIGRRQCCWGLVAFGALAAVGCVSSFRPASDATMVFSERERALGREAAGEVERATGLVKDPRVAGYVGEVGARLVRGSVAHEGDWTFKVLDDDQPNALSLPGGYVYVSRGLLALLNSEDELAGVLGHEVGHVVGRHAVRRATAATPFAVLFGVPATVLGVVSPDLGGLVAGVGSLAGGVQTYPAPGALASEVLNAALPHLRTFERALPPGYTMVIGGEYAKQQRGFANLVVVLAVSVLAIFLALVLQFNHAIKPFLVFAAVPYGVAGALFALWLMGAPFGFMAFLGVVSLIGVIVSHVIVLFDFIEEMHAKGEPLEQALADAGIARLRPVMITVGATVLALFPLALHGGPMWQPLCYAQIGGLGVATFITLLLVPVIYAISVLDLKLVKWEAQSEGAREGESRRPKGLAGEDH